MPADGVFRSMGENLLDEAGWGGNTTLPTTAALGYSGASGRSTRAASSAWSCAGAVGNLRRNHRRDNGASDRAPLIIPTRLSIIRQIHDGFRYRLKLSSNPSSPASAQLVFTNPTIDAAHGLLQGIGSVPPLESKFAISMGQSCETDMGAVRSIKYGHIVGSDVRFQHTVRVKPARI